MLRATAANSNARMSLPQQCHLNGARQFPEARAGPKTEAKSAVYFHMCIRSERQLMERMEFDLLFRSFVGLGVDDLA